MFLHTIATANPPAVLTQAECWDMARRSQLPRRLNSRSMALLERVLLGDSGIARRHFAVARDDVFDLSADELNAAFRHEAPRLAAAALRHALDAAGIAAHELDALFICTCTGYLCPGLSSYVAEDLGLRSDAYLHDVVGLGCGAAIPTLRAVSHLLTAEPAMCAACVAVEVCSAAFYVDDDPGVLISACLFGDGSAATIWGARPGAVGPPLRCHGFDTLHLPADRDCLRFETRHGKLRNLLDRSVPAKAASAVRCLHDRATAHQPVGRVISHAGGRDVVDALEGALPDCTLAETRRVLHDFGNMSSPSVLFGLADYLQRHPEPDGALWLTSFGAGFAAHSCRLTLA